VADVKARNLTLQRKIKCTFCCNATGEKLKPLVTGREFEEQNVYSKKSSSYVLLQENCIDDDGNI
jgi:hypothetical protein